MIIVTTQNIPNKKIIEALGIVSANAVTDGKGYNDIFANSFKRIADNMRNKERIYDLNLTEARRTVMEKMINEVKDSPANAIIGVTFDMEVVKGPKSTVFLLSAYGTAVVTD